MVDVVLVEAVVHVDVDVLVAVAVVFVVVVISFDAAVFYFLL